MNVAKSDFLETRFVPLLKTIHSQTKPAWGKMSFQQMVEHFADAVRLATGKVTQVQMLTPAADIPKMQAFLASDKPFKENTPNPLMPEVPAPVQYISIEKALDALQVEIEHFFAAFRANGHLTTLNPFFGDLNFEMNVLLLYKHAVHHLRQFGVTVNN